ncbi:MAG: hypothetical protein AB7P07_11475, partial [Hyphomonadaceae bacterium]
MRAASYWRGLAAASMLALMAACATAPPTPEELEARAWAQAQAGDSPAAYEAYLRAYGAGPNAQNAAARIETLLQTERAAWARAAQLDTEDA